MLSASSLSHAERLRTLLAEYGIEARAATEPRPVWRWSAPGRVEVRVAPLSEGFALPLEKLAVVTEEEIFGPREKQRRRAARWPDGAAIDALAQLAPGDYLVHAEHGIGIYRGLVELELRGVAGEFLRLEYAENARLFVPVHRLNLVQRYAGSDGYAPRLDKLGGDTWEKAKRSVRKSLRDMAQELISVHAARELELGRVLLAARPPPGGVRGDLPVGGDARPAGGDRGRARRPPARQADGPDRLRRRRLRQDRGGRARRLPRRDGRQPGRRAGADDDPVSAARGDLPQALRGPPRAHRVALALLDAEAGPGRCSKGSRRAHVDIVIGTHRLLQKNVVFRDLGLLVVDEEHRFGVAHKERLKQLKKTVDVLTLTATPIPRTLQLAFAGLRDLSVIDTPPADRLAIRTQVCNFSDALIREAILRELRRGGQVFFVHNRVQTIGSFADWLRKTVPEAKLVVAHGQMPERELEKKMLAFLHGEADVLLCTTIIESGLDVPRANTILIHRADALGLAQLYQLRGRVGRSTQRAYAYLLIPGEEALTRDAQRRLEAIQDLSELGSGFRLANMDLEIRGAGNLLGAEQSGNLAAVGYETYMEMLEQTIDELRGKAVAAEVDPEIRLPIPARLPEAYVASVNQRLVLYKRLASCRDDAEVDGIRDELLDRFGALPVEAQNLIEVIRLKILARKLGILAIDAQRGELVLTAADTTTLDPQRLVNLMTQAKSGVRVAPGHKIFAPAPAGRPDRARRRGAPAARESGRGLASAAAARARTRVQRRSDRGTRPMQAAAHG